MIAVVFGFVTKENGFKILLDEKDKPRKEFIDLYLKYLKEITDETL